MSTSGKYGERQSWRRAGSGEAGKRRTIKTVLTVVAALLILWFSYIVLRTRADRRLRTIVVSNPYDIDVVTPPMFADSVRSQFKSQLDAVDLRGDCDTIRSSFQATDIVAKYLQDSDDTVMVVLRGYLMLDADDQPALACSDLAIGPTPDQPLGLLPLHEILEPLASSAPKSFDGTRFVVLDIEPLAAHPALGQWNDDVFGKLDQALKDLQGEFADRLWVLVTRGPMQNVGWDQSNHLPIATQTLLDGLGGAADLNGDYKIELRELCGFISDRYERLPRNQETETPRPMLLRGKTGLVDSGAVARGDLDIWVNRAEPPPESEEDGVSGQPPEEPESMADDIADKISKLGQREITITPVVMQGSAQQTAPQPNPNAANQVEPTTTDATAAAADSASNGQPGNGQPGNGQPSKTSPTQPLTTAQGADASGTDKSTSTPGPGQLTFWDLRDEFESVPLPSSGDQQSVSAISLAPHLWRQLIVNVLGGQIQDFDPQSPTATPSQVADDLLELQRILKGQNAPRAINNDILLKLKGLVNEHLTARQNGRSDRRLRTADALQHAVAAARTRLWSHLEFQRQAAIAGAQIPDQRLYPSTIAAERTLASGIGSETPDQGTLDRQLSELHASINLFDRNVDGAVNQLLEGFALNDPPRTWELSRAGWAWLRSPLPTGPQRRLLLAAIEKAVPDETDVAAREISLNSITFAMPKASQRGNQSNAEFRSSLAQFEQPSLIAGGSADKTAWRNILQQDRNQTISFADEFDAALRIDPRLHINSTDQAPIVHAMTALPLVRNPSVALLDDAGQAMGESAILRLDTMQDVRRVTLRIDPDRDQQTRLLVSFNVRSESNDLRNPPVDITWKVPGVTSSRPGEPLAITIEAESQRSLPIEIRPTGLAESGVGLVLELQIRADRLADEIEGVVGTHPLPIELPRENRLRLVASSHRGIGCSKEVLSDEGGLPGGLWLRTFNDRQTPFQLEVFNESGKACLAKVWLIKLPNPMPDVAAYWPDFAANKYSNPEGGVLDADGRIQDRYLRDDRVLKGPATMPIPADQKRVPLNFSPPPPAADGSAPAPGSSPDTPSQDVSHGMALVCRLVDQDDNIMPEKDQVIYLVAKPWAPKDYVNTKVNYKIDDDEVEVNLELNPKIDGDEIPDEIPNIEKDAVDIRWVQDDQWSNFQGETTVAPDGRGKGLKNQAGQLSGYFRVPVLRRRGESMVRLDVDGWPRAIQHSVEHQSGSVGESNFQNSISFNSITLTRRAEGTDTPPPESFYSPDNEVYFKGGGEQLIATLKADFAAGVFNRFSNPEVRLEVEDRLFATYQTDRFISTFATSMTNDGVITLLTSVTDLQAKLNQGQRSDDRIPITATLNIRNSEQNSTSITAVLDSTAPETISIRPSKFGPYYAPATLGFTIMASDARRDASGIARLEYGLDTKKDGQADTQRKTKVFDPPVSNAVVPVAESGFKFQVAENYGVVVRAIDAAGNESSKSYAIQFQKPKPDKTASGGDPNNPPEPAMGWLHGIVDTRATIRGTLTIDSPPKSMTTSKETPIEPSSRQFSFGPLPEGKYTLEFKGTVAGRTRPMVWKDLEIDTTPTRSNPLALDLSDAEKPD